MPEARKQRLGGFSLLELVIVVVIIAIIAAIAVPRLSRGTAGAADAALAGNLSILRTGIDLFIAEHNGKIPAAADIAAALTQYSNGAGDDFVAARDATHISGPYIREIPPLPLGAAKGCTGVAAAAGAGVGWIYDESDGSIRSNTTAAEMDVTGKLYSDY